MKRVRGVDEVTPPSSSSSAAATAGASSAPPTAAVVSAATVTLNRGPAGGAVVVSGVVPPPQQQPLGSISSGGNNNSGPPATLAAGASLVSISSSGPTGSIEYHPVGSIGVVSGQTVRTVPPKDMPSSIQFSQPQQQYPGAIVVPSAAPSTIKAANLVGLTNNPTGSMASTVTLHSAPAPIGGPPGNHSMAHQAPAQVQSHAQQPSAIRHKQIVQANTPPISNIVSTGGAGTGASAGGGNGPNSQQFQRLKVEDALSYLDQVKYKFNDQPQVYNDFLDIMKEFKSQSIDTPGVITRVSHLFKGHPELIVGFNTFLPPGYKIEVQSSDQGYALQVSVSMPSPTATHTSTHTATISQHHCSINIGSPPMSSPPSQPAKAQPVVQIMQNASNIHHSITNNISNNNMTLHGPVSPPVSYNNSHVTQAQAQAVSQALSQAQDGIPSTGQTQQSQPVEFNHAINYVNKIKNRFQGQPDKYKRFLEILHTYQKEQRTLKESGHMGGSGSGGSGPGGGKHLTEQEVYTQVAKLFENQEDLLVEFGQFLPDATGNSLSAMFQSNKVGGPVNDHATIVKKPMGMKTTYNNTGSLPREYRDSTGPGGMDRDSRDHRDRDREREQAGVRDIGNAGQKFGHSQGQLKRSPSFTTSMAATGNSHVSHGPPPPKKHKIVSSRDMSIAELSKYGTLTDYAFFDKVRKALKSSEVYENFLRCLVLFNEEVISKTELVQLAMPFLGRFPELLRWLKDFLGYTPEFSAAAQSSSQSTSCAVTIRDNNMNAAAIIGASLAGIGIEPLPNNVVRSHQDRPQGDLAMEIDYSTCKRLGASYCALPKTYVQPRCSGRTPLCKEVLNDTWVSFPTWSEDSTFVTSRKTQFEEFIYRCEDERFELDGVIETNAATIRVLDGVQKKMSRMNPDELQKFKLDNKLGGSSETIHQRALRRIYGEKAADIIDGLKKNPMVAVPVVLRRLKSKEEEWREAQKGFNKIWRDQNEKYYLKSLDHQGINFKQNDVKALRSKSLFNEIEQLYDERHEQAEENGAENQSSSGPHLVLGYKDKSILDDAANLLIHHVKRQTAIHKEDKQKIKQLLKHFVPDLFFHQRQELSDDEQDEDDEKDDVNTSSCSNNTQTGGTTTTSAGSGLQGNRSKVPLSPSPSSNAIKIDSDVKPPSHALSSDPDEAYTLFMASNNWYLFLRLHQILCDRLTKMYDRAVILAQEESQYKQQRKESTSVALRLKPKNEVEVEEYYPAFLDMVKNVLDGNMESNSYEDTLREMFGIHAFIAFTLDKVVTNAVRQLQHLVSDPVCEQCTELFQREQRQPKESTGAGGLCTTAYMRVASETAYQRKAEKTMAEENCFKICIYKKSAKMTIELLDTEGDENTDSNSRGDRESVSQTEKWSSYVERYPGQSSPKDVPSSSDNEPSTTVSHPVSSDQAAKGGRGRKRKNTEISKKIDKNNGWSSHGKALAGRKPVYLHRNVHQYKKEAARKLKADAAAGSSAAGVVAATANSGKSSGQDGAKKPYDSSNSIAETIADVVAAASASADVMTREGMQCTFNLNSYRAVYVVNQESILYKRGCLTRAKQSHPKVTKSMGTKFQHWHFKWVNKNVVDAQHRLCQDWLMGRYENLIPHRTRVIADNDLQRTPYRPYNRYTIDRLDQQPKHQQAAEQMRSSSDK